MAVARGRVELVQIGQALGVRVWNAQTGVQVHRLPAAANLVPALARAGLRVVEELSDTVRVPSAAAGGVDRLGVAEALLLVLAHAVALVGVEHVEGGQAGSRGVSDALQLLAVPDEATAAWQRSCDRLAVADQRIVGLARRALRVAGAAAGRVDRNGSAKTLGLHFAHAVASVRTEDVEVGILAHGCCVRNARAGVGIECESAPALGGQRALALARGGVVGLREGTGGEGSASAGRVDRSRPARALLRLQASTVACLGIEVVQVREATGSRVRLAVAGGRAELEATTAGLSCLALA